MKSKIHEHAKNNFKSVSKKVLLFLACALTSVITAQGNGHVRTTDPLRLPPPSVTCDTCGRGQTIYPGKKKEDFCRQAETVLVNGRDVRLGAVETGGTLPGGGGKKYDFASVDTGGGVRIPPDGKKHDLAFESGGTGATGTIKDGSGGTKKLDYLADTGGSGLGLGSGGSGMGKKQDFV